MAKAMQARYDIKYNAMPIRYKWGLILGYDSAVKAGRARMNSMSKEEKSEFQSKAAKARWSKHNNSNTRGVAHG